MTAQRDSRLGNAINPASGAERYADGIVINYECVVGKWKKLFQIFYVTPPTRSLGNCMRRGAENEMKCIKYSGIAREMKFYE